MGHHGKPPDTIVHQHEPLNAEPPPRALAGHAITPIARFYSRNHGPVPDDDGDGGLEIGGLVEHGGPLALDELRDGRYEEIELTATLQCAGNRRSGLLAFRDIPGEEPWGSGAIGTAVWKGVRLADVLAGAGVKDAGRHVAFVGRDHAEEAEPPQRYGASISLEKALRPEVLLAYEMNGKPLPAIHGGPLRVIVAGYIGARSVKWVERVAVLARPYDGYFQATAYRLLRPEQHPAPGVGTALGEMALVSETLIPQPGDTLPSGHVELRGYAFAGGERRLIRVDVSADGGETWQEGELLEDLGRWAWRRWRATLDLAPGEHELVARAWDSAAATQPEHAASVWNPKGYVNTAWSRTPITVSARHARELGSAAREHTRA